MGKEKELGIDHIYVVHAPVGYEKHEKHLFKELKQKYGFDYEFLDGDSDEKIIEYFVPNIENMMTKGNIMCTLNHIRFYEKMIQNEDKYALIFEDDPYFIGNFIEKIKPVINEAKNLDESFFISLENSTLKFPSCKVLKKGKYLYENNYGRCACAYMIDRKAAENMLDSLKIQKCNKPIDHWHNDLVKYGYIKIYWAHPAFVEQGSLNGKLSSTKSTRTQGLMRKIKWQAQKFYKTQIYRRFK